MSRGPTAVMRGWATNKALMDYYKREMSLHGKAEHPDWCSPVRWRIFLRWRAKKLKAKKLKEMLKEQQDENL